MKIDMNLLKKSVVSIGDTSRLKRVMQKAISQQPITIGCIGGSITQGASASSIDKKYASLVHKWWQTRFPCTKVDLINAGIGATGSLMGAHRVQDHLLKHAPDFVVVEYAVNDPVAPIVELTYEGLIRQILKSKNNPGVMLVFLTNNRGENAQDLHKKIGFHYKLSMASYRDAFWPEIAAGRMKWTDISPDEVHPNDSGHKFLSEIIAYQLDAIFNSLSSATTNAADVSIPAPLVSDLYENARILYSNTIEPVTYGDWAESVTAFFSPGWKAQNKTYAPMIMEIEARSIGVIYKKFNVGMGRAEVQIDDRPPVLLEGHFPCHWGGYPHGEIIAHDLKPGKHLLKIRKFKQPHPESTGNEFELSGILVAKCDVSRLIGCPHPK
ncbi:MAG: SGNH/GDSL hydrolase family protein [Kiritimatiellaeota bacterium]|nr:SGNH/GDSL hydrolase family protein [Kiritimatiellota bacterium]